MVSSTNYKYLLALGQTGDGKSFLLNTLAGYDPEDDNAPFKVGSEVFSSTKFAQVKSFPTGLFKNPQIPIQLMDTLGFYDTNDRRTGEKYKDKDQPNSIKSLMQLDEIIRSAWKGKANKILLCIQIGGRLTADYQNIISMIKMFFSDASRIMVILTQSGGLGKKSREEKLNSWKTELTKLGIEQIFTAGVDGIDDKERFKMFIESSQPIEMKTWSQLTKDQKKQIGEYFYYTMSDPSSSCFALNQTVQVLKTKNTNNLQIQQAINTQLKDLVIGDQILSIDDSGKMKIDTFIGIIHYSQDRSTLFLKIEIESIDQAQKSEIIITPDHFIEVEENDNKVIKKRFIPAKCLMIGQTINRYQYCEEEQSVVQQKYYIQNISKTIEKGFIAPLTLSGTLLVNGLQASCYADYEKVNHEFADKVFYLIKKYLQSKILLNKQINIQDMNKLQEDYTLPQIKYLQNIHRIVF